jgi:hypothetical protein
VVSHASTRACATATQPQPEREMLAMCARQLECHVTAVPPRSSMIVCTYKRGPGRNRPVFLETNEVGNAAMLQHVRIEVAAWKLFPSAHQGGAGKVPPNRSVGPAAPHSAALITPVSWFSTPRVNWLS